MDRNPVFTVLWFLSLVVVKFDGSLRPPSMKGDPYTAAASATISTSAKNQDILYLGGLYLDTSETFRKSGQVEFSGLLLGLKGILAYENTLKSLLEETDIIYIKGDCKTAIQQMQGRAKSRKLGPLYELAKSVESQIPWKVQYEHCPRENNILCDRICYGIIQSRHEYFVDQFYSNCVDMLDNGLFPGSQKSRQLSATYVTSRKSIFKGLDRLLILSILARFAWLEGDFGHVRQCGIQMQDLSESLRSILSSTGQRQRRRDLLRYRLEGVSYEIGALYYLGLVKEATKVKRREKSLLRKHELNETHKSAINVEASTSVTILKLELWYWKQKSCTVNYLDVQSLCSELSSSNEEERECHHPQSLGINYAAEKLFSATSKCPALGESHWIPVDVDRGC
jgi:hypothetical protein